MVVRDYKGTRLIGYIVPTHSTAICQEQIDSGLCKLNFRDERYLPVEGAGAECIWKVELPTDSLQFDYDTITDFFLRVRYASVDVGDKLKTPATGSVQDYIKSVVDLSQREGLFAAFDLRHDFLDEWYQAMNPAAGASERILMLKDLHER